MRRITPITMERLWAGRLQTLDSKQMSTRALIITALAAGIAILVAFAAQVLIAV